MFENFSVFAIFIAALTVQGCDETPRNPLFKRKSIRVEWDLSTVLKKSEIRRFTIGFM
jgi:hypothetical protein